jgi:hypothetical protein
LVRRHSQRAEEQIALEDAVNLDLPIVAYEMRSVRWDDLDSVAVVSELGRRGHPAIRVDIEIRRLLRHCELLLVKRLVEPRREFFTFGGRFLRRNRMAKQSDGSRHLAAVKVIHSSAKIVPRRIVTGPKLTTKRVPRQLFSGGAVFRSKSAIHSLIFLALCPTVWRQTSALDGPPDKKPIARKR